VSPDGLKKVNFTYDFDLPDALAQGEYFYLHKKCAWIEDVLQVNWGWHPMDWVLGFGILNRLYGSLKKHLQKHMPPGAYDALYTSWLPALKSHRPLAKSPARLPSLSHARVVPAPIQEKTLAMRFAILKRDGYRCRLCGVSAKDGEHIRLEVDHITPRSKGGTDDPSNLWVLCFACNRGKGIQEL